MVDVMNYPGGKNGAGVYQTIINQIPPHRVYVEAFAGSAAVWRFKRPAELSYLLDLDSGVIGKLAAADLHGDTADERSIIGGDAESGRQRQFDLCFPDPSGTIADSGSHDDGAPTPPISPRRICRVAPAIIGRNDEPAGTLAICADATRWLPAYPWRGDEFVYADPPYLLSTRSCSTRRIYRCEIQTEDEHAALLDILLTLPCPVMLSGYISNLYAEKLSGWRTVNFQAMTRGGKPATEYLWMNYPAPVRLHDYRYLGENFRQRQDFKRLRERWLRRLADMSTLKRQALLSAIEETEGG